MGFIGDLLGGGKNGANFQAQSATILNPTTTGQASTAYDQTQQGIAQQQAFLQALQAQNGIQNQQGVFNQLQGVANGTGPNPAMAALNNATGQNVANQAALMAGQRGAGQNAGLLARQTAMQGANTQQQAAGQGAALQAQQSLGALNQLGGIAGQQVGQQAQALQGYNQAAQGQQQNLLGSIANQNTANVQNASQANTANAKIAEGNQKSQNGLLGGLLGGLGSVITGGALPAIGGAIGNMFSSTPTGAGGGAGAGGAAPTAFMAEGGQVKGPRSKVAIHLNHGGSVTVQKEQNPVMLSPGEKKLSPQEAANLKEGKSSLSQVGEMVPGKAKVKGDSKKNDTVSDSLPTGAFVIPRHIMEAKDADKKAADFVRAHMSKREAMSTKK